MEGERNPGMLNDYRGDAWSTYPIGVCKKVRQRDVDSRVFIRVLWTDMRELYVTSIY